MNYYLAIDIGASSGRHILSWVEEGRIKIEEIYRFENGLVEKNGALCWNHDRLFSEIVKGLTICKEKGKIPVSVGVDTWGVDFVLLDRDDNVIGDTVSYRDDRIKGMDTEVYKLIDEKELYYRTGIQKAMYNSIYQLMAIKQRHPEQLEMAESILFTPDYFNFLLSGVKKNEYTISTTSQLINAGTGDWDMELIERLGYPKRIFNQIVEPKTEIGNLRPDVAKQVGFDCKVIAVTEHDTASAVLAVPSMQENSVYISSGTWSLMGVEQDKACCSDDAMRHNMTNEGGYNHRYRFLKNIMGLWMIQSVKKESGTDISFDELCKNAAKQNIPSIVDCYDDRFLAPDNMTAEIAAACEETNQPVPQNLYETASVVYNSLASCYGNTIRELEELTGEKYSSINVVGGGSNAVYLNELTAKYTGRTVYAGPSEATAIGNLTVQMIALGEFEDLSAARQCIFNSFGVNKYE